jgi:hypothetical protein
VSLPALTASQHDVAVGADVCPLLTRAISPEIEVPIEALLSVIVSVREVQTESCIHMLGVYCGKHILQFPSTLLKTYFALVVISMEERV